MQVAPGPSWPAFRPRTINSPAASGLHGAIQGDGERVRDREELEAEDREEGPVVFLTVRDADGNVVRHVNGATRRGVHRATWDPRFPGYQRVDVDDDDDGFGPLAVPGTYRVTLSKREEGVTTELAGPSRSRSGPLAQPALPPQDRAQVLAFQRQTGRLQRAVLGTREAAEEAAERLEHIKRAVALTPHILSSTSGISEQKPRRTSPRPTSGTKRGRRDSGMISWRPSTRGRQLPARLPNAFHREGNVEVRRARLRRFPYGLFFIWDERETGDTGVIACFHARRDPRRWLRRT